MTQPTQTYIYLISGGGKTKIGLSEDPRKRIKDLQAGCPVPLRLVACFPGSWRVERALHNAYSSRHVFGEWFEGEASPEDVEYVRAFTERYEWEALVKRMGIEELRREAVGQNPYAVAELQKRSNSERNAWQRLQSAKAAYRAWGADTVASQTDPDYEHKKDNLKAAIKRAKVEVTKY